MAESEMTRARRSMIEAMTQSKIDPDQIPLLCTIRDGDDELHIECRMPDGQKGAFIRVDEEFEPLAFLIADLLNRMREKMGSGNDDPRP